MCVGFGWSVERLWWRQCPIEEQPSAIADAQTFTGWFPSNITKIGISTNLMRRIALDGKRFCSACRTKSGH
jgi:hypothetical protein